MDTDSNLREHQDGSISLEQKICVNCPNCHQKVELYFPKNNLDYKSAYEKLLEIQVNTKNKIEEVFRIISARADFNTLKEIEKIIKGE